MTGIPSQNLPGFKDYVGAFAFNAWLRSALVPFMMSKHEDKEAGQILGDLIHGGAIDEFETHVDNICALPAFNLRRLKHEIESKELQSPIYGKNSPIDDHLLGDLTLRKYKNFLERMGFHSEIDGKTLFTDLFWVDFCSLSTKKNIAYLREIESGMEDNDE